MREPPDEFDWIAALRPLARSPLALGLLDDAAIVPSRPGYDLVISEDAMVEGVHFLEGEDAAIVAKRLLRTNLSDLAAKTAEPFGYTLMTAWPPTRGWSDREAFIRGLAEDGDEWNVTLLGGDTVSTPGPLTVSATVFGWVATGKAVKRSGAKPGELLVVLGAIGDGFLGLQAARGEIDDPHGDLSRAYRLPTPALHLRGPVRAHASAAADVSDGLISDALHIAEASGCALTIDLDRMPVSSAAAAWLARQPDAAAAYLALATGGDDYALVCAAPSGPALLKACDDFTEHAAIAGRFDAGQGVTVRYRGEALAPARLGYRHG